MLNNVTTKKEVPKENLFYSLIFNVALPIFFMSKMSAILGSINALLIALAFPLTYAIYDFYKRRQANPISILGFVSILIKGLFALFKVDGFWFAVQEAAIPTFLGIFTIVSALINKPFVKYFIYNENIFNIDYLEEILNQKNATAHFKKLIWQVTLVFGSAFFLGGVLNYILARHIIVSPAATEAFNKELAQMTLYGYVVIVLPKFLITMFGLWWFISRLKKLTGLNMNQILKDQN
jgi:hypothetical protein